MCTRRTGGARYEPVRNRPSSAARLSSRFRAYSAADCPSTPTAASLRVRRYASRNHSTSMAWCSDANARSGCFLASSAIRASLVEMLPELSVSDIVPSFGSMNWTPRPSTGSSRGEFSGFLGTMSVSDFSSLFPRCCFELRFLRSAVPRVHACFVSLVGSCARGAQRAQASGLVAARPLFRVHEEAARSPRFLGCLCARALLSDPGRASRPMILGPFGAAFRRDNGVGLCGLFLSGLNHTARALAVYASWARSPVLSTQDSLPAGDQPLPGGSHFSRQAPPGGFCDDHPFISSLPPPPGLSWRTVPETPGGCGGGGTVIMRTLRLSTRPR